MSNDRLGGVKDIWLESFLAAIEHKTYKTAGEALGRDPSTISRHMQSLEDWLGVSPFSQKAPIELNETGRAFEPVARQIVALLTDFGIRPVRVANTLQGSEAVDPQNNGELGASA